jgi:ectoine hydroxylase-related dioxygenase (phytanoyl-CoA dioxygenase family)
MRLQDDAASELQTRGFVVLPDAVPDDRVRQMADAYDAALASADASDVRTGSTSTRVNDLVNRGEAFDAIYTFPPLLDACRSVIGRPFKLSSLHARTLHPHASQPALHVDVRRDSADWPLLGFILMIDAFRPENGATRFVPGSHAWPSDPDRTASPVRPDEVQACGAAGSLIVFNGSTWHEHAANATDTPRRSIQGAFIPRDGRAGTDFSARMKPDTRARLTPLARYLLSISAEV